MEALPTIELSPQISNVTLPLESTISPSNQVPKGTFTFSTLRRTLAGSKFSEVLPPPDFSPHSTISSSSISDENLPTLTKTGTASTILTVTPMPRLRRCFKHRNPRIATAECDTARGQYRDAIAVHQGVCAADTLPPGDRVSVKLPDVFLRAKRDSLLTRRSAEHEEPEATDIAEAMREGLQEMDWRSLVPVLTQVAGPLVDWRFMTFYRGYVADADTGNGRRENGSSCWSSPYFDPNMLLQDVQGVLDRVQWGRIAAKMQKELQKNRKWEQWGCEWVTAKSLRGAVILRATRKASRACGIPETQLRLALEGYASYCSSSSSSSKENLRGSAKKSKRRALTADKLAQEKQWALLAEIVVEDLAFLSDEENHYKNAARLMKKRLRAAVDDCSAIYFVHCSMLFPGRVDWSLTPEYCRKTAVEKEREKEKEGAEARSRARGRTSSDSWASFPTGTLLPNTKRLSDATTVVAGSVKRCSRDLGTRISGLLLRRSCGGEGEGGGGEGGGEEG